MNRMPTLILLLGLFTLATTAPAQAAESRVDAVFSQMGPAEVEALLKAQGFAVESRTTESGSPVTAFKLSGYNVSLYYYGCNAGSCASLQMYAGFKVPNKLSAEKMNEWNRGKRFSRAYLNEAGDPSLESDLDLEGGVSMANVKSFVETFRMSVDAFAKHVGFSG
jgi:hypothetical protein